VHDFHPLLGTILPDHFVKTRHDTSSRDWSKTNWSMITCDSESSSSTHPSTIFSPYPYLSPPTSSASSTEDEPILSSPPSKSASAPNIRLGSYLSSGRLADTFSAHFGPSAQTQPVVIKLIDLESFAPMWDDAGSYNLSSATSALCTEIQLYLTHLAPLQGFLVPRLHGIYVGNTSGLSRAVVMMVLEDVGDAVADDWESIPPLTR